MRGQWRYLHRAIDSVGDTVEFFFSEYRELSAAKRFVRKAFARRGRPDRIIIDGIEIVHMMRKRQARFAYNPRPSIAEQFESLAA